MLSPKKNLTGVEDGSGNAIDKDIAKKSAEVAAKTIVNTKLATLKDRALGEIKNWNNEDEEKANGLIPNLTSIRPIPDICQRNYGETSNT
ncbi:MAG: hypothetical protein LUQ47_00280 [Methanotrichaceae archaeon]|nr:hypothetical protein [Methanotrichaceae archaeon]